MAVSGGDQLRNERLRRHLTLEDVAARAGVGRTTVHRTESGEPASLETYARVAAALALRPSLSFVDGSRRDQAARRDEDTVHAAMGELEARHLRTLRYPVSVDEPYQHYQFAGRADLIAWDPAGGSLLHIENRTRFPNLQEAAGSYNAKRAYLPAAVADRLRLRGGWRSVTHALVVLWSAEALHAVRLRRSTFAALCPDAIGGFDAWWRGEPPTAGVTSTLVVLDPAPQLGRRRRLVGFDAVDRIDPRYRGYADAARIVGHLPRP
jgi:transcriptional regulator with XRE-family HTH domain